MTLQPEERADGVAQISKLAHAEGYEQYEAVQRSGLPQYAEFYVPARGSGEGTRVCLGYRRCSEFDEGDQPGQDYAVVRCGGGYVVGVVADGVSRSFYGNLAAEYVSDWLVDELWRRRADVPQSDSMESLLKEAEARFSEHIKEYQIPKTVEPYLVQILERKRPKGSQAVFAAFVLNVAKAELALYQVGDIKALVHNSRPEPESVESAAEGRWSSAGKSRLLLKKSEFKNVGGLVIKSDGASPEWGRSLGEGALGLEQFGLMANARAPVDDISFIAVRLGKASAAKAPKATSQQASNAGRTKKSAGNVKTVQEQERPTSNDVATDTTGARVETAESVDEEGGDTRGVPPGKAPAPTEAHDLRWAITIFASGAVLGLVVGTLLTLVVVNNVSGLKSARKAGEQPAQNPPAAQPNPAAQTTPTPERVSFPVEVQKVEQRTFLSHHPVLPKPISSEQTRAEGEMIAHVSAEAEGVEGIELAAGDKKAAKAVRDNDEGGRPSFFVRLEGLTGPSRVTMRVLGRGGASLYETQIELSGREKKAAENADPFLGYYEIFVKRDKK